MAATWNWKSKAESQFDQPIIYNQRQGEILDQVEIQEMNLVPIKAMNAAMELIRMKFSNTGGLLNCQWLAVAAVSTSELPSVDTILHNNRDHWVVTVKGFASTRSVTVLMYVCMYVLMFGWSENLPDQHFAYSIAQIITETLKIGLMACEKQKQPVNSGLYAIKFATALAFGLNPCELRFDGSQLRSTLCE